MKILILSMILISGCTDHKLIEALDKNTESLDYNTQAIKEMSDNFKKWVL